MFKNPWIFDIETFVNCFTLVARKLDSKEYVKFVIHESRNDYEELVHWLSTMPTLIGYNNINFDGQVIEWLWRQDNPDDVTAEKLYEIGQEVIKRTDADPYDTPFSIWDLTFKHLDLMKLNHYDGKEKKTSLKWLEFTTRWSKMADLPQHHTQPVTKSGVSKILSYNKNDVDMTYHFYYICIPMLELRKELARQFNDTSGMMANMSDSSLGSFIFKKFLSKEIDTNDLKRGTTRKEVIVKECLLDYYRFQSDIFKEVHDWYKTMELAVENGAFVLYSGEKATKTIKKKVLFEDMEFIFGTGGLHACYDPGVYTGDEEHYIVSLDVASYYPWLAIANGFYPEHLGQVFCETYKRVYEQRKTYEKGSALNYALKIVLNAVYGKSKNRYSYLLDHKYAIQIVVNGQLTLAWLAEALSSLGRLLLVNTDGLEIRIPKDKMDELIELCEQWEFITGLTLERNIYKKLVIRDVNNYLAVDESGGVKKKGIFEVYKDITGEDGSAHFYNKNPSASIIPYALQEYYVDGKNIDQTIHECNDIFEFLYGIKKQKTFEYWLISSSPGGVVDIEKRADRVLRYFISTNGANIYKFFTDNRKNNIVGVNRGQVVELALNIKDNRIAGLIASGKYKGEPLTQFKNLNRDHYISECYKIIEEIEQ